MASLSELRNVRISKLQRLQELGIDPFPTDSFRTHSTSDVLSNYPNIEGQTVTVAGYIASFRSHGKAAFADLKDATGKIQILIKEDNLNNPNPENSELGYEHMELLDTGDYLEVTGTVTTTKTGQVTVEAQSVRILVKTLRPLPDKWDGLKDKETRLRRRYLDIKVNDETAQRFIRRAKFWQAHREFFKDREFHEINVPVLELVPGGGDATPFVTHMNAIDQDFFLRISHELFLKRLIGGGYEKVYEIGPRFRNEGLSDEHLPEHMAMEFYWAYADWQDGMKFIEDLFDYIIQYVYGDKRVFNIRGFEVDFSKGWEQIDFGKIMKEKFGIDVYNTTVDEVRELMKRHKLPVSESLNIPRGIDTLWKQVRKEITGPAFLINHPKYLSPLQKASKTNPNIVERFQPIIAGSELGNGWSELNNPLEQFERFAEQQRMRDAGDAEAQWLDIDYVEMLEYGMAPTFGYGHSERVFWFLEDSTAREGVPFPQLKEEYDETTLNIYFSGEYKDLAPRRHEMKATAKATTNNERNSSSATKKESKSQLTRDQALALLHEHVKEPYQVLHAKMVAAAMETYAEELGEDKELWYLTGLLHDLDYFEHPTEHPAKSVEWFQSMGLDNGLIHAVQAHAFERTGIEPESKMAAALIACDEMSGLLYAYSLMRPEKFNEMAAASAVKKFKDKAFAAKVSRSDIQYGLEKFGVELKDHIERLIKVFQKMDELN